MVCKGPPLHILVISIPSNGSIQFLPRPTYRPIIYRRPSLNPLKRVNSILTFTKNYGFHLNIVEESQSPQTGQFNSYR